MFSMGESEISFSPVSLHQAMWLEVSGDNGSQQSDWDCCAQLLLAAGTEIEVLRLYFKEKENKIVPTEANGVLSLARV